MHCERQVVLVDASPDVVAAWRYLIGTSPDEVRSLPLIEAGQDVGELECSEGGRVLISWCLNQTSTPRRKLSSWGSFHNLKGAACYWSRARREQAAIIAGKIKHWKVFLGDYRRLPDVRATWFIDPPYQDGKVPRGCLWKSNYPHGGVEYGELAGWVQSRRGQVIACEREGADWLPFKPLYESPTGRRYLEGARRRCREAIWHREI